MARARAFALPSPGAVMALWRLAAGLGAVSNLNDGYPWGIWIAIDVVTGTYRPWEPAAVLSNSFGFGGHNGCLVFGPPA